MQREEKYKAKNVIDIVVFRGADACSAGSSPAFARLVWGMAGVAAVAVPLMIVWAAVALALGRAQERRQAASQH